MDLDLYWCLTVRKATYSIGKYYIREYRSVNGRWRYKRYLPFQMFLSAEAAEQSVREQAREMCILFLPKHDRGPDERSAVELLLQAAEVTDVSSA